jgi:hypothetical protein
MMTMTARSRRFGFITLSSLLLGAFLAVSPGLAASENGKGHGQGGVNGGNNAGGNAGGNNGGSNSQASGGSGGNAFGQSKTETGIAARDLGKLNGFFNSSENALRNASASSSIGKISVVYAGLLQSYIVTLGALEGTGAGPTLLDLQTALLDATNKPLSPEIVASINQRLLDTNTALAAAAAAAGPNLNPQILAEQIVDPTVAAEATVTTIY